MPTEPPTDPPSKYRVRTVYLVPSDRQPREEYRRALVQGLKNAQIWYAQHVDGRRTFTLSDSIVETVRTTHTADWYATQPNGVPEAYRWWTNARDDAFAVTGGRLRDSTTIWLYYIDSDPPPGQYATLGAAGVALLGGSELRGLAGLSATEKRCRFVGSLSHELGHALGLPHPPSCESNSPSCPGNALMWTAYADYPNAVFTADDQAILSTSPFLSRQAVPGTLPSCNAATVTGLAAVTGRVFGASCG